MPKVTAQIEIGFDGKAYIDDITREVDDISKNPTVVLARKLTIAVGLAAGWSYEGDTEEVSDLLRWGFERWEHPVIRSCLLSSIEHGWKPYVATYELEDGNYAITRLKALAHKQTDVILDRDTGDFKAFINTDPNTSQETRYNWPNAVFINFDETMEGRIGVPSLIAAKDPHMWWRDTNVTANRYDRKLAGGFIIVHYPVGTTLYNGVDTPNDKIADDFLVALQSSGAAKIPRYISDTIEQLNTGSEERWKIEIIGGGGGDQGGFINRLKYLDACILRCLGWTERSVTEGQFGTKAEAGEHADMALLNMHTTLKHLVAEVNEQMVTPFLAYNYGSRVKGHLIANELSDSKKALFRGVLSELMTNPSIGLEIAEAIDSNSILDVLGLPYNKEEEGDLDERTYDPTGIPGAKPSIADEPEDSEDEFGGLPKPE